MIFLRLSTGLRLSTTLVFALCQDVCFVSGWVRTIAELFHQAAMWPRIAHRAHWLFLRHVKLNDDEFTALARFKKQNNIKWAIGDSVTKPNKTKKMPRKTKQALRKKPIVTAPTLPWPKEKKLFNMSRLETTETLQLCLE